MESDEIEDRLREALMKVNATLCHYEPEWTRCQRYPGSDIEKCMTFEDFVEKRVNFELSQLEGFQAASMETGGHLFRCAKLIDSDDRKRKFSMAIFKVYNGKMSDQLKGEIEKVVNLLGGSEFEFNSVKKKIKITIR